MRATEEVCEYMACVKPLQGFLVEQNGRKALRFSKAAAKFFYERGMKFSDQVAVPCGQCMPCRVDHSREWGVRCYHESTLYEENSFVTLTFDEESLRSMCPNRSLDKEHMRLFMMRLRKRKGDGIRVFYCGEYGGLNERPHYHLLLFNCGFFDKKPWMMKRSFTYYRSAELESLWPYGISTIGEVSYVSSAYVARYCTKKIRGAGAKDHYGDRLPEFCQASLKPGIGSGWFDKFWRSDLFPRDECVVQSDKGSFRCKMPRYYDKKLELIDPGMYQAVKAKRIERALLHEDDNTAARLVDKEKCFMRRMRDLERILEV